MNKVLRDRCATVRWSAKPYYANMGLGFRCARLVEPTELQTCQYLTRSDSCPSLLVTRARLRHFQSYRHRLLTFRSLRRLD